MTEMNVDEYDNILFEYLAEMVKQIEDIAVELDVSSKCAQDVRYLRTRNRWSEELEQHLIELHNQGYPPNIYEFGC